MIFHMLSTSDNPFNPYLEFDAWYTWDEWAGYNTLQLQARVVVFPYDASDLDQSLAVEYGILEIMAELGEIKNTDGEPFYIMVPEPTTNTVAA